MALITVSLSESVSGDSVTLRAPAPDIPVVVNQPSVTHMTAGGGVAQYKTGAAWHECTLKIPHMDATTKGSLETFFRSHWGKSTVSYTDERGTAFSGVRFLDDSLRITKVARGLWTCDLHLRLPSVLQ